MHQKIRVTDQHELNHLDDSHQSDYPSVDDRRPVIAFLRGDIAYEFASSTDLEGYGDTEKLDRISKSLIAGEVIELPVLHSNYLDLGRFQVFDGRHRATVFAVADQVFEMGHFGPALYPDNESLKPAPFLTLTVFARKLEKLGYLVAQPEYFDTSKCTAPVFAPS